MKTILDEGDEVKFKSYCLKHSKSKAGEPGLSPTRPKHPSETEKVGQRAQRLKELEEEFHTLIQPEELAQNLDLSQHLLDFIFQYWKLKRKSNFNRPLLPPKEEEENLLLQPQEDSIHTRMRMFMHLRQDLERVGACMLFLNTETVGSWLFLLLNVNVALIKQTQFSLLSANVLYLLALFYYSQPGT